MADQARVLQITKDIFSFADTDGSGALDKEEFKAAIAKMIADHGMGALTEDQMDQEFSGLDVDGSGTVDEDELQAFVAKLLSAAA
ncbi:unnamed protein product [Blepharisma stoltei]|uniref:EF-hand domain-containing protein n=1 Tax=Blepharisma stoltei TaxID=1481888 RepID=A0AAU9KD94_9CILI|nr:unnamed protein product [Blepharisma stoltei]